MSYFEQHNEADDALWVGRALAGHKGSFDVLVGRYLPRIYAVAYAHLRDHDAAEDLAQEVFLRAYLHLSGLKEPSTFCAWLVRITRNLALNWLRNGQTASRIVPMIALEDLPEDQAGDKQPSPREQLESRQEQELVRKALMRLPVELREVLLLHYSEGLSKSEIARMLGVHNSSVCRQVERGLELLRGEMNALVPRSLGALRLQPQSVRKGAALLSGAAALSGSAKAAVLAATSDTLTLAAAAGTAAPAAAASTASSAKLTTLLGSGGSLVVRIKLAVTAIITIGLVATGVYAVNQGGGAAARSSGRQAPKSATQLKSMQRTAERAAAQTARKRHTPSAALAAAGAVDSQEPAVPGQAQQLTVSGVLCSEDGKAIKDGQVAVLRYTGSSLQEAAAWLPVDAAGRFELPVSSYSALLVGGQAPGYPRGYSKSLQVTDTPLTGVVVVLAKGAAVRGKVVDENGTPIDKASIHAQTVVSLSVHQPFDELNSSQAHSAWADDALLAQSGSAGQFALDVAAGDRARQIWLIAEKPGYACSRAVEVGPASSQTTEGVRLVLGANRHVAGKVTTGDGQPLVGAEVTLYPPWEHDLPHLGVTDASGHYRIDGLQPSWYSVLIEHRARSLRWCASTVTPERDDADFSTSKTFTLVGHVVDYATSSPVAQFSVKLAGESGLVAETDPARPGTFTIHNVPDSSFASYEIQAPGCMPLAAKLSDEHQSTSPVCERTFRMGPGGAVCGRVVEEGSVKPLEGCKVWLRRTSTRKSVTDISPVVSTTTDADGRFRIEKLNEDEYDVIAQRDQQDNAVTKPVVVSHGATQDAGQLELGHGATLKGRLVSLPGETPIGCARIVLWNIAREWETTSRADGSFEFLGLAKGWYTIRVLKLGISRVVELSTDQTKEVVLRSGGTGELRGRVVRGGRGIEANVEIGSRSRGRIRKRTDREGNFSFEEVEAGPIGMFVTVSQPSFSWSVLETVEIAAGKPTEKTVVFPSGRLVGQVALPSGQAVEHLTLYAEGGSYQTRPIQLSVQPGSQTQAFSFGDVWPAKYRVTAVAEGGSNLVASVPDVEVPSEGDSTSVTLKLSGETGTLVSGVYSMVDGKPLREAWCQIQGLPNEAFDPTAFPTLLFGANKRDANGLATITRIPPGRYAVHVSASGYASVTHAAVEIKAGQTVRLDDVLNVSGGLVWRLLTKDGEPRCNVPCSLVPSDPVEKPREGTTNGNGSFALWGLTPGTYTTSATLEQGGEVKETFTVTAGKTETKKTVVP